MLPPPKLFLVVVLACGALIAGCRVCSTGSDPTMGYQVGRNDFQDALRDRVNIKAAATIGSQGLNILVLSGGGANGAWGAGFLKGWSESPGGRPKFDVVTGVSTGALQATAALLGDNETLQTAFTTLNNDDIQRDRFFLFIPFSNSLKSSSPLKETIKRFLPDRVIDKVADVAAREHRRVYVATVNLDSGHLAIWNLSKMATDRQYDLYRDAVFASASAPVIYPPVEIGGHLHVDGGARAQMFLRDYLIPAVENGNPAIAARDRAALHKSKVFVIMNGGVTIDKECPANWFLPIALRSVGTLVESHSLTDLYLTKYFTDELHYDFKYSYIPDANSNIPGETGPIDSFDFRTSMMKALFEHGETYGKGPRWAPIELPDPNKFD